LKWKIAHSTKGAKGHVFLKKFSKITKIKNDVNKISKSTLLREYRFKISKRLD